MSIVTLHLLNFLSFLTFIFFNVGLVWFLLFQFVASTVQSTNIKRDERKEKIKKSREEDATERKGKRRETEKECGLGGFMNHY